MSPAHATSDGSGGETAGGDVFAPADDDRPPAADGEPAVSDQDRCGLQDDGYEPL